ncbi:myeloid leukemia factor 1 isoform X1 [Xyrichtys novacula]|uniref:Myeloid leukemia factor 1 isoform X1 n=1 Tax=Xyrichtys novacula TaxID=13765 RepID=A0AAV1FWV1_XYRNO|nr:myeloid leukemia factor 1 isoform X1 [Xyrichtys novacula]
MFNSQFREFEEDPFFSDPFGAHRDHMRHMMRSFSEPFGGSLMPSLMDGRNRGRAMIEHPSASQGLREEHRDMSRSLLPFGSMESTDTMRNPFGMFDNMMSNVRNRMEEMHRNFENMSTDSNTHSFSSSSVMTYSKVGNEAPKVFQASSSTRRAPGGIRETRQALKDSESGVEKMSIGHHIQDRGHVVEKKYNKKTGEKEFNQDFQNLDESEAQTFDAEWQQELSKFQSSAPMSRKEEPRLRGVHRAALTAPEQTKRDKPKDKAEGKGKVRFSDSEKQ